VSTDPLAPLEVIDRLEVGPVVLEGHRLTMPYVVHQGGGVSSTELAYRFEEEVFDPEAQSSRNLASLIGAQVALNYGLFCREIVFHGPFDAVDRTFLIEMAENTAREIYVKKFLEPNPFLQEPAVGLPAVRERSYLRAVLRFPDLDDTERRTKGAGDWSSEAARIAVLSSGAYAQGGFAPPELATTKVRDNLYLIRNAASGNVTVLVADDGVVLVDDKFAMDHDGIMAELRKITDKPVLYVINTHLHQDHSGGNAAMQAISAKVIAHENARRTMAETQDTGLPNITIEEHLLDDRA